MNAGPPSQRYEYVVWFRDPSLPAADEDYEWPAVFLVEARCAEDAKSWGDQLAWAKAARHGEIYLRSRADPYVQPTGETELPVVPFGFEASDGHIGW